MSGPGASSEVPGAGGREEGAGGDEEADARTPDPGGTPVAGVTLVTGATGFVGSHAAEALVEAGHDVRCTVRASSDLRWIRDLDVERVELDLADPARLPGALEDVRTVVHAAGVTRAAHPGVFRRVNVEGTLTLARAARDAEVERFVFVSSLAARGPDGADGPVSAYGRSKHAAEAGLRAPPRRRTRGAGGARRGGDLSVVVLRPGGVYGPRDTDLLPLFRMASRGWLAAPTGGSLLQPLYVGDAARAILRAAEGDAPFGPWPLAEAGRYGWDEVVDGLAAALGRRVRRVPVPGGLFVAAGAVAEAAARVRDRPPDFDRRRARDLARHAWSCDPRPSEEALGWRPRIPLPVGLGRTAAWYREAGWL